VNKASRKKREKSSARKERKATKTLAIVLGKSSKTFYSPCALIPVPPFWCPEKTAPSRAKRTFSSTKKICFPTRQQFCKDVANKEEFNDRLR
jgi:hypothetical protein